MQHGPCLWFPEVATKDCPPRPRGASIFLKAVDRAPRRPIRRSGRIVHKHEDVSLDDDSAKQKGHFNLGVYQRRPNAGIRTLNIGQPLKFVARFMQMVCVVVWSPSSTYRRSKHHARMRCTQIIMHSTFAGLFRGYYNNNARIYPGTYR